MCRLDAVQSPRRLVHKYWQVEFKFYMAINKMHNSKNTLDKKTKLEDAQYLT